MGFSLASFNLFLISPWKRRAANYLFIKLKLLLICEDVNVNSVFSIMSNLVTRLRGSAQRQNADRFKQNQINFKRFVFDRFELKK